VFSIVNRLLVVVAIAAALVLMPLSASAQATPSPTADPIESLQSGVDWLVSQQGADGAWVGFSGVSDPGVTIDAVIALAAAANAGIEVDLSSAVQYLSENGEAYARTGTGQAAKLVLAAVAAGEDPTTFAGLDSVEQMQKAYNADTDLYGTGMYDTALVTLALSTVDKTPPGIVMSAIEDRQMADGSWAFDGTTAAGNGDTNTTAIVVQALVAIGETESDQVLHGIEYLQRTQLAEGFPFQSAPGAVPDANSTALVVQALIAAGEDPSAPEWQNAFSAMMAFQVPDGSFSYLLDPLAANLFATVQVIPALATQAFPVQLEATPVAFQAVSICTSARLVVADLPCAA
jgi:hypothetical protein